MKLKRALFLLTAILIVSANAQLTIPSKNFNYTSYGQVIYWNALDSLEKRAFLHSYLYRTYEIMIQIREDSQLKSCAKTFEKNIAMPVFNGFSNLEKSDKDNLIGLIDSYYKNNLNREKPFYKALYYAFENIKMDKNKSNINR